MSESFLADSLSRLEYLREAVHRAETTGYVAGKHYSSFLTDYDSCPAKTDVQYLHAIISLMKEEILIVENNILSAASKRIKQL